MCCVSASTGQNMKTAATALLKQCVICMLWGHAGKETESKHVSKYVVLQAE